MCDSITNGGSYIQSSGGSQSSCPPANVIIASNVLSTNGNVICGNLISQDGTFTGNLYVAGQVIGNIFLNTINSSVLNTGSIFSLNYYGNGSGLSNLQASNLVGTISATNLPTTAVAPGTYGSSANVFQGTIDQYGRVTQAANVSILSSQWTTIHGNVAYQNGVSIGTISDPPPGSNLYVLGTANISTLNVDYLTVNSAVVYGTTTLNVYGISNLNSVIGNLYTGNGSGLSNINSSNIIGTVATAISVTGSSQPNITSVGTLSGLAVQGLLVASNGSGISNLNSSNIVGILSSSQIYGNTLSNINASNLAFGLVNSSLVYGNTLSNINASNIVGLTNVSGNTLSNINASNLAFGIVNSSLIYGNTLSNIQASNISGLVTVSGNTLSNINASNLAFGIVNSSLIYGNTLSNINASNITGLTNVSGNTLSNINASNLAFGVVNSSLIYGNTLSNINASNITGLTNVSGNTLSNINASNLAFGIVNSSLIYGNTLSNIQSSNITQPFANLAVSNSVTTTFVFAQNIYTTGGIEIATDSAFHGNLDVTGNLRPGAIVDYVSSVGSAGQFLTSTGSSIEWSSAVANLVVSNTVTTSEIICNAFTTSTATNWNYVSNAATARSTSVGWQGIRQVFGDYITGNVYVYNNAVLEVTLSYVAPGFGSFVAVGGLNDEIIVVSGVDAFYVYYFDGLIWNGPIATDTTDDLGVHNTLWMPSLSAEGSLTVTLVIGGYGFPTDGGGNPAVGIYIIIVLDGTSSFAGSITPFNDVADKDRNTVAISGDRTTVAIGQQDSSYFYVYSLSNLITPVFSSGRTNPGIEYYVSIDYYGQIVLLTLQDSGQVLMYSISLAPV